MRMMTDMFHKWKIFAKYIKTLICLFINFANCNPFVVIYMTRHYFHSYPTNQKSLFLPSPNFSRCAKGLLFFLSTPFLCLVFHQAEWSSGRVADVESVQWIPNTVGSLVEELAMAMFEIKRCSVGSLAGKERSNGCLVARQGVNTW